MANYMLIRYQADNIPTFDGNPKQVNRFINACTNFITAHNDLNNVGAAINIALFDTILSKLVGRAADLIASRIELNTWDLVKNAIIDTFSDQRSIDCVIQDIITMKPERNENPQQFGIRLQDARSLLFSKVNVSNDTRAIKLLKIEEYGKLVMKTFITGLNYHMQLIVRLKNPDSLEQAMSFALEEENFLHFKNNSPNLSHKQTPTVNNTNSQLNANKFKRPVHYSANAYRPQNIPNSNNYMSRNYNPNFYNNFNPQRNPNFNQFNAQNPNQFRPFQNNPQNFNNNFRSPQLNSSITRRTVEPMDTTSINTAANRSIQRRFAQMPQHNLNFQELVNQPVEPVSNNTDIDPNDQFDYSQLQNQYAEQQYYPDSDDNQIPFDENNYDNIPYNQNYENANNYENPGYEENFHMVTPTNNVT